jgi:hypothetical protein
MHFEYRLVGTGWASATIAHGGATAELTASYLSDALGVLLLAVEEALSGAEEARCSWDEEPGEYRWIFKSDGVDVDLEIKWFDALWGDEPDENGRSVFAVSVALREAAVCFAGSAQAVLDKHGTAGYLEKWLDFPFPAETLSRIQRRLSETSDV